MKNFIKFLCITLLLPFFAINQSLASTMAIGFPDEPTNSWVWPGATIGWGFTTSTDILVDGLGVWDELGDGLAEGHAVGIWALDGTLLTSAIVGSGTANPLDNSFRWVDIPSFSLNAGSYVVGAYFSDNSDRGAALTNYTTASEITFNKNLYLYDNGFTLPTNHWQNHDGGNFGANFRFERASVPEPSALFLFAFAIMALGVRQFKK